MDFISLRFTGNGILPSNTRCKDLASVIRATEDLIQSLTPEDYDGEKPEVDLCLVDIEAKSLGLKYATAQMAALLLTWQTFGNVLTNKSYEKLNSKAIESLGEIVSFVKKRGCIAELGDSTKDVVLASITSDIQLPEAVEVKGQTSVIGTVVRVGGSDPKVGLKLASGKTISCDSSEVIAKSLGHRLYEVVTCKGEAVWNLTDNSLSKFRIKEVTNFRQGLASEAFASLALAMPDTLARWNKEGLPSDFANDLS